MITIWITNNNTVTHNAILVCTKKRYLLYFLMKNSIKPNKIHLFGCSEGYTTLHITSYCRGKKFFLVCLQNIEKRKVYWHTKQYDLCGNSPRRQISFAKNITSSTHLSRSTRFSFFFLGFYLPHSTLLYLFKASFWLSHVLFHNRFCVCLFTYLITLNILLLAVQSSLSLLVLHFNSLGHILWIINTQLIIYLIPI